MRKRLLVLLVACVLASTESPDQEPVFSGPQAGENFPPFKVRGFFDPNTGKELDFVAQAAGKPIVLVFIHDPNRPSLRLTQALTYYTAGRAREALTTGVIWLTDDATEAESILKSKRGSLTPEAPTGISLDGKEGPGSYGLNRTVTLTILIGKEGRVTANFALVQPSIQADLPKILSEIGRVMGGPAPTVDDLLIMPGVQLQGPILQFLQRTATPEEVDKEAAGIEKYLRQDEAARKQFGHMVRRVVDGGKLASHGSPKAQQYLRKWAKDFGGAEERQ
jgi:hypothetical protein